MYGEYAPQVFDALLSWFKHNVILGPRWELPMGATVIKMTCREKGPGKCRIIMDQSAPRGKSTNDAIDVKKFPAEMAGMKGVLMLVNFAGRGSKISKLDWRDAYKHVGITQEQWKYQWFRFAGALWAEKCCTFGCKSSPGIFCSCARILVAIVCMELGVPHILASMHLDDLILGGRKVAEMTRKYRELCEEVGVNLQPHDDKFEKALNVSSRGVCLGVTLDLENWLWWLEESRVVKYTAAIDTLLGRVVATIGELKSVGGENNVDRAAVGGQQILYDTVSLLSLIHI